MEFEYQDPSRRRGKVIIVAGVIVALIAGGLAFFVLYQARQEAQTSGVAVVPVVVAAVPIAARIPIVETDVVLRQVPADGTNAEGVFTDPAQVVGLMATVPILAGQPVYANMLATGTTANGIAILQPGETVSPDSEAWRAVSLTVPDDRAVGGLIQTGDIVDVFVTASVTVPDDLSAKGRYTSDKSTKITYQNVSVIQRSASSYIVRVNLAVAEEISHLQATGTASFSLGLRPSEDTRIADVSGLGETTNAIIKRYGLPIPEVYPAPGPSRRRRRRRARRPRRRPTRPRRPRPAHRLRRLPDPRRPPHSGRHQVPRLRHGAGRVDHASRDRFD